MKFLAEKKLFELLLFSRKVEQFSEGFFHYAQLNEVSSDIYIHLAGKAHDLKHSTDKEAYIEANFRLTQVVFDRFLSDPGSSIFIFLSSVKAVADEVDHVLFVESPCNPLTDYGQSKMMAERYILDNIPSDKKVFIFRYSDNDGSLSSAMEHGDLFYKLLHKQFSNH
jgi:nucleoside-diphosphate-sugar epimerase